MMIIFIIIKKTKTNKSFYKDWFEEFFKGFRVQERKIYNIIFYKRLSYNRCSYYLNK